MIGETTFLVDIFIDLTGHNQYSLISVVRTTIITYKKNAYQQIGGNLATLRKKPTQLT